ncbi:RDD family protein [Flavobacterium sp. CBA20B-1]|uniref:RDD family protein n=1 Tax=unclassified Flavobacterium TaxID=196869 RepID=UPI0022253A5A|nr:MULTISPECIES: RDD family protein [unclassified Flavobacterium]WCM41399.1 RDD family protein [Flavobacterium sp. CBA20B-1]
MDLTDIVQKNKASKGLRFANYLIDFIAVIIVSFIVGALIGILSVLFNFDISFLDNELISRLFGIIIFLFYYACIETLTKGRSIGKYITGTKVVTVEGEQPANSVFLKRSFCRLIPFEAFSFLGENGWHDSIPKSAVVVKKDFEQDLYLHQSVNAIGTPVD